MSVLKIKNAQGEWQEVPFIKGDKGDKGDTYVLTEEDKEDIAGLVDIPIQIKYVKDDESDNGGVIEGLVILPTDVTLDINAKINKATGENAHAEGGYLSYSGSGDNKIYYLYGTEATGQASHAEGANTHATTTCSHAEGYGTTASGINGHAEGTESTASGVSSHAEGKQSKSVGEASHAEGYNTISNGKYSHTEGSETQTSADGYADHAEGKNTIASGGEAHAEGHTTTASGAYSHSEGRGTVASSFGSHAEGFGSVASGQFSHAENSGQARGSYSHAENTGTASGNYSHAEGYATIASGYVSHAEGQETIAKSSRQHVEGKYNIEDTNNTYAHIVGNGTSPNERSNAYTLDWNGNGVYAGKVTVGAEPTNDSDVTTKKYVDDNITASTLKYVKDDPSDNGGVIEGVVNYPEDAKSIKNTINQASGAFAHVEGGGIGKTTFDTGIYYTMYPNIASGDASHAEGRETIASGFASHAEGGATTASGQYSHSEGNYTVASGYSDHAEGNHTTASGMDSHAEGFYSESSGTQSHAEGAHTVASGWASHASGYGTIAKNRAQTAIGAYNEPDPRDSSSDYNGKYVFIVGGGSSDNNRKNIHTLDWDGNGVYSGKVTVGSAPTNDMDVATKKYVDDIKGASIHICSSEEYDSTTRVPTIQNPDEKTFYLVPSEDGISPDLFVEWAYVNNAWEMFGSASIDLSNYVTNTDYATANDGGVVRVNGYGLKINASNGIIQTSGATSGIIKSATGSDAEYRPVTPLRQHESTFYGLAKASGDSTQSASANAVGTYTDEAKASIQNMLGVPSVDDIPDVPVEDVQINGTSIVTDGVADIPVGNNNIYGVMRSNVNYGTTTYHTDSGDFLGITFATPNEIKNPNTYPHAIVPYYQDQATFYGLAKVSGDTTQSASSNAVGTYTDDAKASIQSMLGVPSTDDVVTDVQVNGSSITADGVANLPIATKDNLGVIKRKLYSGVAIDADGGLRLELAGDTTIKNGVSTYTPIVPQHQHKSVFYGLAKVAGHDEKDSTLALGQYTPEAKGAIQSMLGIDSLIAPTETNPFSEAHAVGDLFIINGALYKAKTAIAVSDVLDDGVNVDAVNVDDVIIKDVQINGNTVVNNGVASVPIGTLTDFGVVKIGSGLGVNNGLVTTNPAVSSDIKAATANYKQIVPSKQHEAVFYGLATASGDTTQKNSSNAVGTYTDEAKASIQTMLGVPSSDDVVSDVQINGTSVVTDGVASIPLADTTNFGVVKIAYGLRRGAGGLSEYTHVDPATSAEIKNADTSNACTYKPISPRHQHESTFYGLAKASGDTTQASSSNAVGTYTNEAKQSIKQMLGVVDSYDSLVINVTGTDPIITAQPSYRYNCGEVTTLTITPPSSGTIDIIFTSGTTPTVLDLPSTVKMPSWWIGVEANTTYEMCITDGVYCGVMSWDV